MKSTICIWILLVATIACAQREKPVIADYVPDIRADLIESGKLSHLVTLSVPDDERWNPDSIDLNANGAVYCIALSERSFRGCYVGGHFDAIGGVPAKRLAFFEDHVTTGNFSEIGGGVQGGDVYHIFPVNDTELYVAGNFTQAGDIRVNNIAHWNGHIWEALSSGTDNTIYTLALVANDLYAGGNFRHAGGAEANYIAKWNIDSKTWSAIMDDTVNGMDGSVITLRLTGVGEFFAGGGFTKAGTVTCNKIAKMSNGKWSSLINGVQGTNAVVNVIQEVGYFNGVYVGGEFTYAGGIPVNNIVRWTGTNWAVADDFPNGFNGPVYAMNSPQGLVFVGGSFLTSESSVCNNISGGSFERTLGSGLDGPCYALGAQFAALSFGGFENHLYVGGLFNQAGQKLSKNFAIWGEPIRSVRSTNEITNSLRIYPNPAQSSATISFSLPERKNISLSVIDLLGRQALSLGSEWYDSGAQQAHLDTKNLLAGMYYCLLQSEGKSVSAPFLVLR